MQVDRVDIIEEPPLLLIRVVGSHFLWRMVRRMVGVLVAVGRRELKPADVPRMLAEASDESAALAAPASGLFLERVYYPDDNREGEIMQTPWAERYAQRTQRMRSSAVRELLKLTEQPDVISFAGGPPRARDVPGGRVHQGARRASWPRTGPARCSTGRPRATPRCGR